ncbi:hypoxanthine phosphoribosyltransferase [Psittacicella gerlachiana]|uniref:Hypoxanthine phosphoribosyltransferase n=1 Tax=Psittacicella gerlachiana TaxID=2028574 RepID=A0A3A1YDJ1_9GAMM|nr:hypoxanthine phosphoribosyltransferase [Psittacicella gerlachiana]RIY35228.1 hypoxanthine phosphoribosyltransferase [Psittacicella gerlachiana]
MKLKQFTPENFHVWFNHEEIKKRNAELGEEISRFYNENYPGEEVLCVGLLRGAVYFLVDLTREMTIPLTIDFMTVSSYGDGTESTLNVKILKDLDTDISGKHVLIIEDIIDTGHTLNKVRKLLLDRNPKSLHIVTCADKPARRLVDVPVDWVGFEVENRFTVGYGFEIAQKYRNVTAIGYIEDKK